MIRRRTKRTPWAVQGFSASERSSKSRTVMFSGGTRKCLHEDRQRALRDRPVRREQRRRLAKSRSCVAQDAANSRSVSRS